MNKRKYKTSNLILFFLLFLSLISFYYADVNSNIRQGMNFWKALFEGKFFQYYSINVADQEAQLMYHNANYDMIMNFFMGIWQLPLYILEKILGCNNILIYFPARIYGKLYYLVLLYLAGFNLRLLAKEIGFSEVDQQSIFFMFCSSSIVILSICNVTQADIIAIIFLVLAILYLVREDKKWILFFVLACQCKNFAFFILVPIILLKEKKVIKILTYALLPWVIQFIIDIPFRIFDASAVALKTGRMTGMLTSMVGNKIDVFGVHIPIIFIVYIMICIFAYMKQIHEQEDKVRYYLYYGLLGITCFFACFNMFCYWAIYMVPFLVLLFFINKKQIEKELILELVATSMYALGSVLTHHFCFEYNVMNSMLIDKIIPFKKFELHGLTMLYEYLSRDEMHSIWTITYAVFVAWLIYFFIENRPSKKAVTSSDVSAEEINIEKYLWIRAILGYAICNITVIFYAIAVVKRTIEVLFLGG